MNILHAHTSPDMLTRLREMLASASRADIAVGYFFISGFAQTADDFARLRKTRVLVGQADRPTLEAVAAGMTQADPLRSRLHSDDLIPRSQRNAAASDAAARVSHGIAALDQTDAATAAIARLRGLVASGLLEMRAYPRGFMHAKAYLCWYDNHAEPGAAIVGSSNFTLAGFSGNTELNVRVTGDAEMSALKDWFNALWEDSIDINAQVQDALNRSWALKTYPPYLVYLKALRELYGDELGKGALPLPSPKTELADFQQDAVARALAMIEARGGCYIGDVVGLGKTFIGAELLRQLRLSYPDDGLPLIICPAGLKPMWERFSERFGLGAEVVSQSVIAAPADAEFDEELGRYIDADPPGQGVVLQEKYSTRGPVLVDEAHNFRNINKRYIGLKSYLEAGDHKVVLMSATPQNLGPKDIYRQLSLFLHETEHGLNIEPIALSEYFNCAEAWRNHQAAQENYPADYHAWQLRGATESGAAPPAPPNPPAVPKVDISQALTPVFIRRRRKDITELYGDNAKLNGQPIHFPKPTLSNVEYRLDNVYAKAGSFDSLLKLLEQHTASRYRAVDYIKPECANKPEYRDLYRARNRIARLMDALLVKRLESSIKAFRSTLDALTLGNRNFRQALVSGYVPIGQTATRLLADENFDADAALDILRQEEERRTETDAPKSKMAHSVDDFHAAEWIQDIDSDYETLSKIQRRISDITPQDDDKLCALANFLRRDDVKDEKILIFSEAETTVKYLHEQLNPDGANPKMAQLTGANRAAAPDIIRRFAPKQNAKDGEVKPAREIQILLATDVVSEGQNLQDCARILNYDLHWNPVRLIQRFGRIDRLGSEHENINLHNMWPDAQVNAMLALTDRLQNRIQSFHNNIGLDNKLLSDAERLNSDAMYRIYWDKALPDLDERLDDGLDEVAASQRAIALLQRIRDADPDLWAEVEALPDGIRSALRSRWTAAQTEITTIHGSQPAFEIHGAQQPLTALGTAPASPSSPYDEPLAGETLVLLADGGIKSCYAVGSDLAPRPITPAQFAAAAECPPDELAQPLPADTNPRVMAAVAVFKADMSRRLGSARRPSDTRNRRYLSRHLSRARETLDAAEYTARIETLRRVFLSELQLPAPADSAITEIRNMRIDGAALIARLEALRERYRLNPPDPAPAPTPTPAAARITRIVCSDALL